MCIITSNLLYITYNRLIIYQLLFIIWSFIWTKIVNVNSKLPIIISWLIVAYRNDDLQQICDIDSVSFPDLFRLNWIQFFYHSLLICRWFSEFIERMALSFNVRIQTTKLNVSGCFCCSFSITSCFSWTISQSNTKQFCQSSLVKQLRWITLSRHNKEELIRLINYL